MAYIKTPWLDDSLPAINASNLNKIEDGIYNVESMAISDSEVTSEVLSIANIVESIALVNNNELNNFAIAVSIASINNLNNLSEAVSEAVSEARSIALIP